MSKDVIEMAKEIKRRSELVLTAEREDNGEFYKHWNALDRMMSPQNLIKLCDAVEELANYENMEPIAIYNLADGEFYKSIHDIGDNKSVFAVNLYPHPNK